VNVFGRFAAHFSTQDGFGSAPRFGAPSRFGGVTRDFGAWIVQCCEEISGHGRAVSSAQSLCEVEDLPNVCHDKNMRFRRQQVKNAPMS